MGVTSRRLKVVALAVVALVALRAHPAGSASHCHGKHWVGVWATSPSDGVGASFRDQTLRLVVNPTFGGARVRVRLSNRYGSQPVTFGAVSIARRASGAELVPGTNRPLRFARKPSVTIAPGAEAVSDAARLDFDAFEDLVVGLHVKGVSGRSTEHVTAFQTSYMSVPGSGDQTDADSAAAFTGTLTTWPFLTDVEIRAPRRVGALVAVGDSITDGVGSPSDQNRRYPDLLARRLATVGARLAVQIEAISGNEVLRDSFVPSFGRSLLDRLDRDVLDRAGARVVILMEGTNDIGVPPPATAAQVIGGLQTAVDRMHRAGLRVILGTLPPCKNFPLALHGTPEAIVARNQINDWIRTSAAADGVVDFHAALRDPTDPDRLRPEFDSGDHLHPNVAGYEAMADAVDLTLLENASCRSTALGGAPHPLQR
jgi:lysophospholipase L1-like esterase